MFSAEPSRVHGEYREYKGPPEMTLYVLVAWTKLLQNPDRDDLSTEFLKGKVGKDHFNTLVKNSYICLYIKLICYISSGKTDIDFCGIHF